MPKYLIYIYSNKQTIIMPSTRKSVTLSTRKSVKPSTINKKLIYVENNLFGFEKNTLLHYYLIIMSIGFIVGGYFLADKGGGFNKNKTQSNSKKYTGYVLLGYGCIMLFLTLLKFVL